MDKNKMFRKIQQCQNNILPKRVIVDDRNSIWKSRKSFDPVAEQQTYEFSQIPFAKKIQYAARYFTEHCHDCYCRDPLVSPTSKYLYRQENSSDDEEYNHLRCTCPLEHGCGLKYRCGVKDKNVKEVQEGFTPFLKSKKNQCRPNKCRESSNLRRRTRRRQLSKSSDKSSGDRQILDVGEYTVCDNTCFNKTQNSFGQCLKRLSSARCSCEVSRADLENAKTFFKDWEIRRKVIKSQGIADDDFIDRRSQLGGSADVNCSQRNFKTCDKSYASDVTTETGLSYTKQREKYELHNVPPSNCVRRQYVNQRDNNINEKEFCINDKLDLSEISDFRDQFYFETHNPFTKSLPQNHTENPILQCTATEISKQPKPEGQKSIEIDRSTGGPNLNEDVACHKCIYSFELNSRLQPIPLNADIYGRSCCDECGRPMRTIRHDGGENLTNSKNSEAANNNLNSQQKKCSQQCPALEQQRIYIGCGDERIKLTVPSDLLEASIGHSDEITSKGHLSMGSKSKQSKGGFLGPGKLNWNDGDHRLKVNPAEKPNSLALRQQKFSMYNSRK